MRRTSSGGRLVDRVAIWPLAAVLSGAAGCVAASATDRAVEQPPRAPRPLRRVLLLNQYSPELPVNQITSRAIREVMSASTDLDIQLFEEYVDQSRLSHQVGQVLAAVTAKYKGTPFDLVIANGTPVVAALLERPQLFAGVPKVITTVGTTVIPREGLPPGMTGVLSRMGYEGTLELATRLLPGTLHVLLLSGHPFSVPFTNDAMAQWERRANRLDIEVVADATVEDAVRRVADLPSNAIVLYDNIQRDEHGGNYVGADVAAILSVASRVPVFCVHETHMGRGCVAGHMVSYADSARRAAVMGTIILHGAPIKDLPPQTMPYEDQADWRELQRWGLNPARLPEHTRIVGRDPSAWERNRSAILLATTLIALQAVLIGALVVQVKRRRRSEGAARALGGRMIQAQEEERRRIARELHDSVNQRLSLLMVDLQQLKDMKVGGDMLREVTSLSEEARGIADEVRDLSHELHSSALTHLGLPAALRELGRDLSRRHDIHVTVQVSDRVPRVDYRPGLCLFRVAEEALTNVIRHAAATAAGVELDYRDGWLRLVVEDNGKGFDPIVSASPSSLGLAGMRERVEVLRGSLLTRSRPGGGARVEAEIPYAPRPRAIAFPSAVGQG
jgi:signal transduction histidine kinase